MLDADDISRLRRLMELREAKDEAEKDAKAKAKEFREAEADLFEILTDPDTGDIRRIPPVDLGEPFGRIAFQARETPFGRIIPGMEQEAMDYFRERHVLEEFTEPKFAKKRLNELVRERLEDNGQMPPGIDFYHSRGVTITRQKG
jgi:hypothetical protein